MHHLKKHSKMYDSKNNLLPVTASTKARYTKFLFENTTKSKYMQELKKSNKYTKMLYKATYSKLLNLNKLSLYKDEIMEPIIAARSLNLQQKLILKDMITKIPKGSPYKRFDGLRTMIKEINKLPSNFDVKFGIRGKNHVHLNLKINKDTFLYDFIQQHVIPKKKFPMSDFLPLYNYYIGYHHNLYNVADKKNIKKILFDGIKPIKGVKPNLFNLNLIVQLNRVKNSYLEKSLNFKIKSNRVNYGLIIVPSFSKK